MLEKKEEGHLRVLNKIFEVGIDEVGKGAVFGPVFSAVVVLTETNKSTLKQFGVMDSKKLTPKKKEITFSENFITFLRLWTWAILCQGNRSSRNQSCNRTFNDKSFKKIKGETT